MRAAALSVESGDICMQPGVSKEFCSCHLSDLQCCLIFVVRRGVVVLYSNNIFDIKFYFALGGGERSPDCLPDFH